MRGAEKPAKDVDEPQQTGRRVVINPIPGTAHTSHNFEPPSFRMHVPEGGRWLKFLLFPLWLLSYMFMLVPAYASYRRTGQFIDNTVRTARYSAVDFFPRQLLNQFSKLANIYFLFISGLQLVPQLSPTGSYTTLGPLVAFVGVAMAREAWDDYHRHLNDREENRTEAVRLWWGDEELGGVDAGALPRAGVERDPDAVDPESLVSKDPGGPGSETAKKMIGEWRTIQWKDLQVGDLIRIRDKDNVPADIVLLSTSIPNGTAYIETSNLDGETSLTAKQALNSTAMVLRSIDDLMKFTGTIQAGPPVDTLHDFEARIELTKHDEIVRHPLTLAQFIPRGATLRNTEEAWGVVVYTGEETRIRRNANKSNLTKAPALEGLTNKIVGVVFAFVLILSTASVLAYQAFTSRGG
ncbi:E1-E2 ATPase-domain-containing protein [Blyttiomyces helicus]|uniref:E1-E2 ATPase-domain-containing protein n=1 Tax=Blyttiomyces helicus TaxID=388810 RepID=A0A4P9VX16_9FUNG|nr:E1-E2 ATPase-domain-containing protein [Blyttiomyces helicus]|eukprot:RKO83762.1 E1-E2 ATPase-domain-containing protein [Blyttiomyces helicus]